MGLLSAYAGAAVLSPEDALERLKTRSERKVDRNIHGKDLLHVFSISEELPVAYVFEGSEGKGYVVVSADDRFIPLLGYSDEGGFDSNNIPAPMQGWLDGYARRMQFLTNYVIDSESGSSVNYSEERTPIEPMIKTLWDQGSPYNDQCPTVNNTKCYTGCIATSMAQVMNYFQYPDVGQGSVSYKPYGFNLSLKIDFSETPFDWDNMLDSYRPGQYTKEEALAVANLMKACGYSVQMGYGTYGSGATSISIHKALVEYFKYDKSTSYYNRDNYTLDEWTQMIYDNLANVGPVIYNGNSPMEGGHSFVCDGYDGNGYFHFNWGWSGLSNGYFSLDVLNPMAQGIGGYSGGYNFQQDIVIGIRPDQGTDVAVEPVIYQKGSIIGDWDEGRLVFDLAGSYIRGWTYNGIEDIVFTLGMKIEPQGDEEIEAQYAMTDAGDIEIKTGYYLINDEPIEVLLEGIDLKDGVPYKFTLVSKEWGKEDENWREVITDVGFPNFMTVTKNSDDYDVKDYRYAQFSIDKLEPISEVYAGCPVKFKLVLTNDSEYQLSRGVCAVLFDEKENQRFMSDSMFITLDPGESTQIDWIAQLYDFSFGQNGPVTASEDMWAYLFDMETYLLYDMEPVKIDMQPSPADPTVKGTLSILGVPREELFYFITDPYAIEIELSIDVEEGYFAYPLTIHILEEYGNSGTLYALTNHTLPEIPFLNGGESASYTMTIQYPDAEFDKTYYMQAEYMKDNSYVWIQSQPRFIVVDEAGVEQISTSNENDIFCIYTKNDRSLKLSSADSIDSVEIFSLDGSRLMSEQGPLGNYLEMDLDSLQSGVLIVNVVTGEGFSKAFKIMK